MKHLSPIILILALALALASCGKGPKPFRMTGFTLHEVSESATSSTMAKSLDGATIHLVQEPLLSEPMAKSITVLSQQGRPQVHLTLVESAPLHAITKEHVGKRLAVVVDGKAVSAPVVREPIDQGSIVISGSFTQKQAEAMVAKLSGNAP